MKIITQQMQPSKILPKPSSATLPSSNASPIMVVSSNGAIMTTKLVSTPTGVNSFVHRIPLDSGYKIVYFGMRDKIKVDN